MNNLEQKRKSSVLEGAFWSWLSTVINLLALLIIGKLFVISLNKEEVATFSLLLVWSDGFILFFGYGLQVSIPKLIGGASDNEKNSLSSSLLVFSIINVIVVSLITLLIWGVLYWILPIQKNFGNTSLIFSYFWIVPIMFCICLPRDILLANLSGFQVFGKRALGVTISSTLQVLFSIFVLVILKGKIVSLSVAYMISYFLTTVLLWRSLPTERSFQLNFSQVVSSVKFSWILWINSILNYLIQRFDTVVLLFLTGSPIQVAVYEMAKRLCLIASRMLGALLLPYLPRISELFSSNQEKETKRFFVLSQNAIAILSFVGIMSLPFIQKYIILLLFSKEYMEITSILVPLLTGIVFAVLSGISGQTLIASNRPYIVTLTNIGTVAINLGLNFLLIPHLGMMGAGWSSLISFFFSYIVQTFWVKKTCIQFEWSKILIPLFIFTCFLLFYISFPHLIWVNSLFIFVLLIISYSFNLIPFEYLYMRLIKRMQVKS